jgi:hypothetical protein
MRRKIEKDREGQEGRRESHQEGGRKRESEGKWRISLSSNQNENESQHKYQSLIVRNKQLATEILKIRSKNEMLKKELQEFRRKQFLISTETKGSQTSDKVRKIRLSLSS